MPLSVVVADDQQIIREHICKFITDTDPVFEIAGSFEDGADVIEYLKDNQVDIIFTDVLMCRVSGIDVAKYVYENKLKTHVIIISAYKDFEFARSALSYGVRDYLIKPTSTGELRKVLETLRDELMYEQDEENLLKLSDNQREKLDDKATAVIKRATEYMKEHYMENISIADVADYVHLNDDYFGKLIKKKLNMSFSDYLTELRMQAAMNLLKTGKYKIYQIGEKVGYKSSNYFIKSFKTYTGYTPGEYCQSLGVDNEE